MLAKLLGGLLLAVAVDRLVQDLTELFFLRGGLKYIIDRLRGTLESFLFLASILAKLFSWGLFDLRDKLGRLLLHRCLCLWLLVSLGLALLSRSLGLWLLLYDRSWTVGLRLRLLVILRFTLRLLLGG